MAGPIDAAALLVAPRGGPTGVRVAQAAVPGGTARSAIGRLRTEPISIRGLCKEFGSVRALADIDLEIRAGEFLTLLGPSGSGKSTLLMALAGFLRPTSGSIRFGEREVVGLPPHKREIGVVFQSYALFPHMDVAENVAFPLRVRRRSAAEIADRVAAALATVRLPGLGSRRVDQLSGGQRQRVALARAIAFEPPILLMDEPLSALDKQLREEMQTEIREIHDRLGITTVYVTHDQREALTMSDRVAVIHDGRLQQVDRPSLVYDRPRTSFIARFLGESSLLPVTIEGRSARLEGIPIGTDGPLPDDGSTAFLLVRPERLVPLDPGASGEMNVLTGSCVECRHQGESFLVTIETAAGHKVTWRPSSRANERNRLPAIGDTVSLGLSAADSPIVQDG